MADGRQWGPIPSKAQLNIVGWYTGHPYAGGTAGQVAHTYDTQGATINTNSAGTNVCPPICQYGMLLFCILYFNIYYLCFPKEIYTEK